MTDAIPDHIRDAAVDWKLELDQSWHDDSVQRAFQQWLAADPRHQTAWNRLSSMDACLSDIKSRSQLRPALRLARSYRLRRHANLFVLLMVVGLFGVWVADPVVYDRLRYDYVTGIGERQLFELDSGARMTMNANSAINIRTSASGMDQIELVRGAVVIDTVGNKLAAHHGDLVVVPQGTVFGIAQGSKTVFHVSEGQISVRDRVSGSSVSLKAGASASFDERSAQFVPNRGVAQEMAWTNGMILARDLSIKAIAHQLGPYTRRQILVDPTVENIKVNGAFPLDNPHESFSALTDAAPVSIDSSLPWRIRIQPRNSVSQ